MSQLKRYPDYKASGVPWLGKIPSHWEEKRMRFFVSTNPLKSELNLDEDALVSFVPMESVSINGGLTISENKELKEVYKGYTYFRNGDVVLAKITPCFENGKASICNDLTNGVGFGTTELHVIRPSIDTTTKFVFYLLRSQTFMKIGESEMYGAGGQKRVPEDFIKNFIAPLPPLTEQNLIVKFLDKQLNHIDMLINKQKQLIEKLAEQRSTLITHAVTKGLNPDVEMEDSGVEWLGDIPKHWELVRLRYLCHITTGNLDTQDRELDGAYPFYVRSKNVERTNTYTFDNEAVLMAGDGVGAGKIFHHVKGKYGCHQRVYSLSRLARIRGEFLYEYLTLFFSRKIEEGGAKSTVDSVRLPMIQDFPISLPSLIEQKEIVDYIHVETTKIDEMSKSTQKMIYKLKEYRSALITQAVTGKIDVRQTVTDINSSTQNEQGVA